MKKTAQPSENKSVSISLVCGIIYAALALAVRIMSGSPYEALHRIDTGGILPPLWIFNLLSLSVCFLCGLAAGYVIEFVIRTRPDPKTELYAYKGALFFICLLFSSLLWYPAFFVAESLFTAVITLLLTVLISIVTAVIWSRIKRNSAFLILLSSAWYFYVLILMLMIILKN